MRIRMVVHTATIAVHQTTFFVWDVLRDDPKDVEIMRAAIIKACRKQIAHRPYIKHD